MPLVRPRSCQAQHGDFEAFTGASRERLLPRERALSNRPRAKTPPSAQLTTHGHPRAFAGTPIRTSASRCGAVDIVFNERELRARTRKKVRLACHARLKCPRNATALPCLAIPACARERRARGSNFVCLHAHLGVWRLTPAAGVRVRRASMRESLGTDPRDVSGARAALGLVPQLLGRVCARVAALAWRVRIAILTC